MKKKKILVCGADGFLGSHLTDRLYSKGYSLRVFDRFRDGRSLNLGHLEDKIHFIPGDFQNQHDIDNALKGIEHVFHFVSTTTPASSSRDPIIDIEANLKSTVRLLEKCVQNGVKQVVFASSGGTIYGNQELEKLSETHLTCPISPYGISKLAIERYMEYYRINFGLNFLILRYSNPYGARQNTVGSQGVIPIFLSRLMREEPITIFGDGGNIRDYIFIDDCISMSVDIFEKPDRSYNLYNIGSGTGISLNRIVEIMERVTGKSFHIIKQPARSCDLRRFVLDNSRIVKEINMDHFITLENGISQLWSYLKDRSEHV